MTNQIFSVRESTRSSEASPTANQAALAKLRRRLTGGSAEDGSSGLGDPFAEIFAAMSVTSVPAQPPSESASAEDDEPPVASDENEDDQRRSGRSAASPTSEKVTEPAESLLDEPVANEQVEVAIAAVQTPAAQQAEATLAQETATAEVAGVQPDPQLDESPPDVDGTAIDATGQTQTAESALDADVDAGVGVAADQDRERQESETAVAESLPAETEPTEASVVVDAKSETRQTADETEHADEQPAELDQDTALQARVDRRRYSDRGEHNDDANSQSNEPVTAEDKSARAAHGPTENASDDTTRVGSGRGSGIDISAMKPVAAATTAAVTPSVAAAVSAAAKTASVSAAAGAESRPGSAASVNSMSEGSSTNTATTTNVAGRAGSDSKSANATKTSTGVDTTSAIQRAKLIQRISRGFQHLGGGAGQIRMRLSPDQLGSVQLQMNVRDGGLSGRMTTQSDAATQLLREQLPQLRSALESQGIRLDQIEIETDGSSLTTQRETGEQSMGDRGGGFTGSPFSDRQDLKDGRHRSGSSDVNAASRNRAAKETAAPIAPPLDFATTTPGRVDLQV